MLNCTSKICEACITGCLLIIEQGALFSGRSCRATPSVQTTHRHHTKSCGDKNDAGSQFHLIRTRHRHIPQGHSNPMTDRKRKITGCPEMHHEYSRCRTTIVTGGTEYSTSGNADAPELGDAMCLTNTRDTVTQSKARRQIFQSVFCWLVCVVLFMSSCHFRSNIGKAYCTTAKPPDRCVVQKHVPPIEKAEPSVTHYETPKCKDLTARPPWSRLVMAPEDDRRRTRDAQKKYR